MNLRDYLEKIAQDYPAACEEKFKDHPLAKLIRADFTNHIQDQIDEGNYYRIKGSVGQGQWADTPWIAIMDPLITDTTRQGYYVLYSFSKNGKYTYLSLAQGVTFAKEEFGREWLDVLKNKARIYRAKLRKHDHNFTEGEYDLGGTTPLSKEYGDTTIIYKQYKNRNLPNDNKLIEDLEQALKLYGFLILAEGNEDYKDFEAGDNLNSNDIEVQERKTFKLHRRVEGRVNSSKVKKLHGYSCQACGFNYEDAYGEIGKEYIEAHHLIPFTELEKNRKRTMSIRDDFAVLCANCHRMIHRLDDPSNLTRLIEIINRNRRKDI